MNALLSLMERRSLVNKLTWGFACLLALSVAIGAFSLENQWVLNAQLGQTYEADLLGVSNAKDVQIAYLSMGRTLRQALIEVDPERREQALAQTAQAEAQMHQELEELRPRIFRPEARAALGQFEDAFAQYKQIMDVAVTHIRDGRFTEAMARVNSPEFERAGTAAAAAMSVIIQTKEEGARASTAAAGERAALAVRLTVLLILGGVGLGVLAAWLIVQSIRRPLERVRTAVETLARGELDIVVPHADFSNEMGGLARSVQVLQAGARQIEEQRWLKSHLALLSNALQTATSFAELSQTLFSAMAPLIQMGHGALYRHEEEQARLCLLGAYADCTSQGLEPYFALGEGLLGQCALERAPIYLQNPPDDYARIGSSLGGAAPRCIALLPIVRSERLLGVLELATFSDFGVREQALLDGLAPILAMNLEILERSEKGKALLEETQAQAQALRKQAVTLEAQAVELEAQQDTLKGTEAWFRGIIQSAPDGMLVCNELGVITLANPTLEAMFGYAEGELPGHAIEELVPQAVREAHVGLREAYAQSGSMRAMGGLASELHGVRKDGTVFPVEIGLSRLPALGGRGNNVCASVRDVTERKAAAQALADERARLQSILDCSPVNIAFVTEKSLRFANPKFRETFGIGPGDRSPGLYVNPEDRAQVIATIRRDGIAENCELQMYDRHQQIRDMLATFVPLNFDGEEGTLGWIMDITERKKTEVQLAQRMGELERFNRLTIDREERMIDLKREVNTLMEQLEQAPRYRIVD